MIEVKKLQTLCILETPEPKFYHAHDAERDATERR